MTKFSESLIKNIEGSDSKEEWLEVCKSGDPHALLLAGAEKIRIQVKEAKLKQHHLVSRKEKLKQVKAKRNAAPKVKFDFHILIIDDDLLALEMLRDIIAEVEIGKINVLEATTVRQALELIQSNKGLNLIISDYELPDANGIQLLNTLKQRNIQHPEVFFISGHSEMDIVKSAIKIGAKNWILKPFDPVKIIATIEQSLKSKEAS